jgi:hypothetical protein
MSGRAGDGRGLRWYWMVVLGVVVVALIAFPYPWWW